MRLLLAGLLAAVLAGGCAGRRALPYVSLDDVAPLAAPVAAPVRDAEKPLRVAIAPVITPQEDMMNFQPLLDYLEKRLGRPVRFVPTRTYEEINERMKFGGVDVALVCSYAYVVGHQDGAMDLLAAPVIDGKRTYNSLIIVRADSRARGLGDLRGKAFASSDPLSYSGRLAVTHMLWRQGETPESFFSRYIFTYSHANSVKAVAAGVVDGAAVDSAVFVHFLRDHPAYARRVRVIARSEETGILPFVVRPGLEPALKAGLEAAFLEAHLDPGGRAALSRVDIDRFLPGDDGAYDNIRRMVREMRGS